MLYKYLFKESYAHECKLRFKCNVADGIADSIDSLFCTYDDHNSQYLTRLLLKSFKYPIIYLIYNNTSINNYK